MPRSRGFSLIEIMISLVVLSLIFTGISRFVLDTKKSATSISTTLEIDSLNRRMKDTVVNVGFLFGSLGSKENYNFFACTMSPEKCAGRFVHFAIMNPNNSNQRLTGTQLRPVFYSSGAQSCIPTVQDPCPINNYPLEAISGFRVVGKQMEIHYCIRLRTRHKFRGLETYAAVPREAVTNPQFFPGCRAFTTGGSSFYDKPPVRPLAKDYIPEKNHIDIEMINPCATYQSLGLDPRNNPVCRKLLEGMMR